MVDNPSNVDNNSGSASPSRIPVATRAMSLPIRATRWSSDYIVLSVPVRSNADDDNIIHENDEQSRFDSLLQIQQRLERHVAEIRNQQTRLNHYIDTLN